MTNTIIKVCKEHAEKCSCGYTGYNFNENIKECPACKITWEFEEHTEENCEYNITCPTCYKPTKGLRSISVYDSPFDDVPDYIKICSDDCYGLLFDTSYSDFRYFTCGCCNRVICEQNPKNGYHIQYRIAEGEQICLRCYEKEILENGIPEEKFKDVALPGMFFSIGNCEPLDKGYAKEGGYFISGSAKAKEICNKAIDYINKGYKVVVGYERLAITGNEGSVTLFIKKEKTNEKW